MTAAPGRTTILEAVNIMLGVIGEQPVSALAPPSQQVTEAVIAQRILLERHKEGQGRGWTWNTERDFPFAKDLTTGEVPVPANAARAVISRGVLGHLVVRGSRVYDTKRFTYQINEASVPAEVTWYLHWDDCPEIYNRWALCSAARVFAARVLTDQEVVALANLDEQAALSELQRHETLVSQPNVLHGMGWPYPTFDASELGTQRRTRWR
jgi:hypothetical protein